MGNASNFGSAYSDPGSWTAKSDDPNVQNFWIAYSDRGVKGHDGIFSYHNRTQMATLSSKDKEILDKAIANRKYNDRLS